MFKIRPPRVEDIVPILEMHKTAVFAKGGSHYTQAHLEEWSPGSTPARIAKLEKEITDPNLLILVATTENDVLGFTLVNRAKSDLGALYVKPNKIGHVGRTLLAEIEKQVFAEGLEFLTCDSSLNAADFYVANGYTDEGHVDHVIENGNIVACRRMRKHNKT